MEQGRATSTIVAAASAIAALSIVLAAVLVVGVVTRLGATTRRSQRSGSPLPDDAPREPADRAPVDRPRRVATAPPVPSSRARGLRIDTTEKVIFLASTTA
jgi:hypothetical protein